MINRVFSKSKEWTLPTVVPPCFGGPQEVVHVSKTSIPTIPEPQPPISFIHHSDGSTSLSSSFSSYSHGLGSHSSNVPVRFVMVHSRFSWYEILLAMSFGVPVALLSVTYEYVGDNLVPAKLFASDPHLFHLFIILDAFSFTATVIGVWLHSVHARISKCLSLFAFASLMVAFTLYLWVLLPRYLKWLPCVLFLMVLIALLYVHLRKGNNPHLEEYDIHSGSILNG